MIQIICDKCGKDCDLNAFVIGVEVIHNPSPHNHLDFSSLKLTDDNAKMRMCLCQDCYKKLNFPNIYKVQRTGKLDWKDNN